MDMTCVPSKRVPRLLKTCGMLGVTHSRRSAQLERLADAERARKLAVCLAVTKHKSSLRRVVRGLSLEHGLCPRR